MKKHDLKSPENHQKEAYGNLGGYWFYMVFCFFFLDRIFLTKAGQGYIIKSIWGSRISCRPFPVLLSY